MVKREGEREKGCGREGWKEGEQKEAESGDSKGRAETERELSVERGGGKSGGRDERERGRVDIERAESEWR